MERKEGFAKPMDKDFCSNNNNGIKAIEDINNVDPLMNKVKVYKVYSPLLRQVNGTHKNPPHTNTHTI